MIALAETKYPGINAYYSGINSSSLNVAITLNEHPHISSDTIKSLGLRK